MRTTVNIDAHLLAQLKSVAEESGRTMSAVIEDAIRVSMARRADRGRSVVLRLPTFSGGGLQPGVDLDDSAALLDLMEGRNR